MSVVGRAVVKSFPTRTTSERALCDAFVVGFQVTIETNLLSETLITAGTFVGFLSSMDTSVPI